MSAANIRLLWRMYGPWVNTLTAAERATFAAAGIRIVEGCILQHWVVPATVTGPDRWRHACYLHGLRSPKVPPLS
jgi:hypothetical protein